MLCVSSSLSVCILPLLNILVRASSDEFPDVAAESNSALTAFQERQIALGSRSLIEVLEENIFTLATELPRKIMDPGQSSLVFSSTEKVLIAHVAMLVITYYTSMRSEKLRESSDDEEFSIIPYIFSVVIVTENLYNSVESMHVRLSYVNNGYLLTKTVRMHFKHS